jgi:hypothetical protein
MLKDHVRLLQGIDPDELSLLQRVFDRACEAKLVEKRSDLAVDLAAQIINLYQHGVRDEQQLLTMVTGTRNFP